MKNLPRIIKEKVFQIAMINQIKAGETVREKGIILTYVQIEIIIYDGCILLSYGMRRISD